jgi:hypothetical protein
LSFFWRIEEMKRTLQYVAVAVVALALLAANAQAAFLTEAHPSGVARENFLGVTNRLSIPSYAPGLSTWGTATGSVYGANDTGSDWPFIYTPAFDKDNFHSPAGYDLKNGYVSSGLVGGAPGLYSVYMTWPLSDNPPADGCKITVSHDDGEVVLPAVVQKTGFSGSPGGNGGWYRIAERIHLTTGTTYTIHLIANAPASFPSMRCHGVLWELVEADPQQATIVESEGVTNVTEGGASDTYAVTLVEQPPAAVVVSVEALDPNQLWLNGELDRTELTFRPDNWNVEQIVTVEAFDDLMVEGDHSVMVLHKTLAADPNDNGFGGLITVNITDNEAPGIRITESDGATSVAEQGSTSDTYTVRLLYPPTANVTINITADDDTAVDTGGGAGPTAQLIFTQANWYIEQTVTVSAVDDDILEREHWAAISHSVSSVDSGYDGFTVRNIVVRVEDNECGVWSYSVVDINKDCYVDLGDLATVAQSWLDCTQPYGDGCVDLR